VYKSTDVVQVNIPAESGEMGILANHVPSIEQLKPGLIEVIEESGGSKQFFRASLPPQLYIRQAWLIPIDSLRWIRRRAAELGIEHQRG
jgi:hypothetical protein